MKLAEGSLMIDGRETRHHHLKGGLRRGSLALVLAFAACCCLPSTRPAAIEKGVKFWGEFGMMRLRGGGDAIGKNVPADEAQKIAFRR